MSLRELLFGKPIPDDQADVERIGVLEGVPVLGLDALASAAYGPEAALTLLIPVSAAALGVLLPITAAIVGLLLVVQFSYRQTIAAYPEGGGSYTVAKANLGRGPGLLAAAALLLDYILNVAVAISAGVGALVSAAPSLLPHTLVLCLVILLFLVLVNLRGVRTAGIIFMLPTYAFVGSLGGAIAWGIWRALLAGGHPAPAVPPHPLPVTATVVAPWLVIRAFASGCTAMTGIEAVSNAVPIFRNPAVARAQRTLSVIGGLLALLLVGIAVLCRAYGIGATEPGQPGYQSVLSQLVSAVAGRGPFYYTAIAAILAVLCLSANTSFADFPRVCRLLALDEHLPEAFAHAGRRLVYTTGVLTLGGIAAVLLVAFGGITDRLIPLFAVGAFTAFTCSQAGMVAHWARVGGPHALRHRIVNGAGAVLTAVALVVIVVAKFTEGAWVSTLIVASLIALFQRTRAHYEALRRDTADDAPLEVPELRPPVVVVPVRRLDRVARKGIRFALSISPEVHAVQVLASEHPVDDLRAKWAALVEAPARQAGLPPPRLVLLRSPYREVLDPIARYVRSLQQSDPDRFVAVVVPELIQRRWYHYLFQSHGATILRLVLLYRCGPGVAVIDTPWFLREEREPGGPRVRLRLHRTSQKPHPGLFGARSPR